MKMHLLLSFVFSAISVFGQPGPLTKVLGTKCSMIPPGGFVAATTFSGFQNAEKGASIMINELPAPYQPTVDGFTAEALKTRGMTLISKATVDHHNKKATLIKVTQQANAATFVKQIFVFGDSKVTVLVNGMYPETEKEMEGQIREALFSTVYSAVQNDDPLDAVSFSIEVKDTEFKLAKYLSGSLIYSVDGKMPTERPILIIGNSVAKIPAENQKRYAEERLKRLPRGEFNIIKELNELTIDNLKGFEIVANGQTKDGAPELVYQVMLFDDKGDYYIIVGQSKEQFDQYLGAFRKIAKSFRRK
jgi:hypothetical protein